MTNSRLAIVALLFACTQAQPRYGDSSTFDPDGYYVPSLKVTGQGQELAWIEINSLEYFYGDSLHYDRPLLLTPTGNARFRSTTDTTFTNHTCERILATRDTLSVQCRQTPWGMLTLDATWLDRRGKYWNIIEYELHPTIVAIGQLTIGEGPSARTEPVKLGYTGGH